ncbi:DNAJC30 [Branchiostoma lanceolatum]|uniref:DNAJC30 protein n=1 Tax=Branchiostoma lanceolatum TaxID=7740 RepID=A0A8J9V930_BRALA|nr:DNAJC30 [Branchiostoma lanceolatum]
MMAAMLAAGRPAKSLRTFTQVKTSSSHPMAAPLCQRNTRNVLKATLGACYAKFLSSDAFSDGRPGCSPYATGLCGGRVRQVSIGQQDLDKRIVENVYLHLLDDPVVLRTIRESYDCERDAEELQHTDMIVQEALEKDHVLKSHHLVGTGSFAASSQRSWPFLSGDATLLPFQRSQMRSFRSDCKQNQQKFYARERHVNLHYYDVLGVSPVATHTQIKTAYYKKSMQFHPDRNKTEYAADRFTEITEAYEVLGHADLRRKYDRGILNKSDMLKERKPPTTEPPRQDRSRQSHSDTKVQSRGNLGYNMDEWLRGHYGDALEQEQRRKRVRKNYEDFKKAEQRNRNDSYIVLVFLGIATVIVFMLK